jgi:hypothetical protein
MAAATYTNIRHTSERQAAADEETTQHEHNIDLIRNTLTRAGISMSRASSGFWYSIKNPDGSETVAYFDPEEMARNGNLTPEEIEALAQKLQGAYIADPGNMKPVPEEKLPSWAQFHNALYSFNVPGGYQKMKEGLEQRAQKGQATASEEKMVGYLEELEGNYAKRDAAYARGCKKDPKTCIPRSSVTIIGKVTDTTGAAVDGATISSLGSQSSTKTSTDGAYSITVDVRPPQKVRLRAIKQDYSDGIGTLFVTDAARKTFSGPDIQIAKAEGVITLDTAKRVVVQGTAHTTDSDFIVSGKQSTYTIPFNAIVAPDGQPYRGKVNVYVYEFNEQSVPRNLTNVDTFDDARGYAGNQMKSFGMPYIQFMSDTGKELHVLKSNPMTLSYRIANMKELRNNSAKIYEAVTDADMVKLVQASKLPGYPIDRQYLIDNNMLRFPAFWVFDRTRGVWDNVGVKVMDTDGLIESPFYTISSINK